MRFLYFRKLWKPIRDEWTKYYGCYNDSENLFMMNFPLFIARKMYREGDVGKHFSRPAVFIAMLGIAIGLAVMIVAVAVIVGFKKEVRDKIVGFGSHIQITDLYASQSYEARPIVANDSLLKALAAYPQVGRVQRYSARPGIIKTDDAFQGMILKGIGQDYDTEFFRKHLVEGELPQFSDTTSTNQVLISKTLAGKLKLKLGDKIDTYYIQDDVRVRRLAVAGVYQTNFIEYDNLFLLTDIRLVNRLNKWKGEQVSGIELQLNEPSQLDEVTYAIGNSFEDYRDRDGVRYCVRNVEQLNPAIFAWLEILDVNIWVILILMMGVAGFTMISGLLIIIIERTSMIGVLKSLGANNDVIRRTFLWFSVFLIGKGMLWGNLLGMGFYFLQSRLGIFRLDPDTYYMDTVPVSFNIWLFLLLNVGTLVVSVFMLLGPSYLITRIHPANSMRYE